MAWNAGSVGPAAAAIGRDLDVSLAAVGVLGGTVFFAGLVVAKLGAARLTDRVGSGAAVRVACLLALAGNLVCALSPAFAGLAFGRVLSGLSLGLAAVLGPVLARQAGGVRLLGLFGGSVTVGVAAALGAGGLLRELGVDWRFDFIVAGLAALAALAALPAPPRVRIPGGSVLALARRELSDVPAWRLELLFATALGVPYVLGVWIVPYLTEDVGLGSGLAGVLGVMLYLLAAAVRPEGARLESSGRSLVLLGGVAPVLAAGGLGLLALADGAPLAIAGTALAGVGFAIPYAAMYDEAARLFPTSRVAAIGLFSLGGNALPLLATPPVGAAIATGDGDVAMLALALVSLMAGLANLSPVVAR